MMKRSFRKRRLIITIESAVWKIQSAPFIVVDDKKANIIGRNLLPQIGIKLNQEQKTEKVHAIREQEESQQQNNMSKTITYNCAYVS